MLSRTIIQTGSPAVPPEPIPLRAGPLTMLFEPGTGFLRCVRLGDREILRGVYAALRDRNWGTVAPRVSNLELDRSEDRFHLAFDVECKEGEIDFFWRGSLSGEPDGTVTFRMEGTARSTFLRSRIGFCVLHPVRECAGQPSLVEKADGSQEQGAFPFHISPHQPFQEMRSITHEVTPGLRAEVRFEGDIFEMEDQRNWTDASFKTYCTPLRLPYPVQVREGDTVTQSVTLTLKGDVPGAAAEEPEEVTLRVLAAESGPLPSIGLGTASHGEPLAGVEIERLKALRLSHLRVDLELSDPGFQAALRQAAAETYDLGISLEAALFLTEAAEAELEALLEELENHRPPVRRWLVFHREEKSTGERWLRLARAALRRYDPEARVGAGTNAYFTELNRGRPPVEAVDFVCYSINPQVHAFDNRSLVENLEAQALTVASALEFCGGCPIVISPVTLRPRFNPNATGPEEPAGPGGLPPQVDPRQMSLFGAGWTLGSLKYLAEAGIESVTYYETTGWRGVMERTAGPPAPERFPSVPGGVFPLYHVLADAGKFAGGRVVRSVSSDPLAVECLALTDGRESRLLIANLGGRPRRVRLEIGKASDPVRLLRLDDTNAEQAIRSPEAFRVEGPVLLHPREVSELELPPYGLARLDWTEASDG